MNEPLTRDQADKIIAEGEKRYSALLEMRIDQLERELNAANEKIKKLEEAGDRLAYWYEPKELRQFDALNNWKQAKEDKP